MKLCDIIKNVEIIENNAKNLDMEISSICYDSRKVQKGSMFVCLSGVSVDGHDFAKSAMENGAKIIVSEHLTDADLPHIIVNDTRSALFYLIANFILDAKLFNFMFG